MLESNPNDGIIIMTPTTRQSHDEVQVWQQQEQQQQRKQRKQQEQHTQQPNYHIVFSTGCDQQQEWESYVFFYHAMRVQQRGNVTRIASGCSGPLQKHIKHNHQTYIHNQMSQNFHIHFTPDYSYYNGKNKRKRKRKRRDEPYKYMNKPHGLYHWMTNVLGMKLPEEEEEEEEGGGGGVNNSTTTTTPPPPPLPTTSSSSSSSSSLRYSQYDDDIIILMDPDMILLRPIGHDFTNDDDRTIYTVHPDLQRILEKKKRRKHRPPPRLSKYVTHNKLIAQHDGYLTSEWMKFNISYITTTDDGGKKLPQYLKLLVDGENYWNAGPPYMGTARDMFRITTLWKEYVPRIYEEYPKLFAEMYGYIIASTQLLQIPTTTTATTTTTSQQQQQQQQPQPQRQIQSQQSLPPRISHTLIKSLVVSTTKAIDREGWKFIDDNTNLPNSQVCNTSLIFDSYKKHRSNDNDSNNNIKLPIVLHYCGRYLLGDKWFFSKYRLKKQFISCETPLLTYPPLDSATRYDYWIRPPPDAGYSHEYETENITKIQAKREAFMICGLIHSMNEAAKYYKSHHCNNNATTVNWNETYDFHSDPNSTRR